MRVLCLFLLLLSPFVSAKITEFSTKNNTYPEPKPPTAGDITDEMKNRIVFCPTLKDSLPIWLSTSSDSQLTYWYNANVIIGRQYNSNYSGVYSDYFVNTGECKPSGANYGYSCDPKYNYISNNRYFDKPFLNGYTPYLTHTVYERLFSHTKGDVMPLFVSNDYEIRPKYPNVPIIIPNKDFSVFEILIYDDRFYLRWNDAQPEWLYNLLSKWNEDKQDRVIGRIRFFRYGYTIFGSTWFNPALSQPYDTPDGQFFDKDYADQNVLKNIKYTQNSIRGDFKIDDIRRVSDIRVNIRKHGWGDHNKAGIWVVANEKGKRQWIVSSSSFIKDGSTTQAMLDEENKFYMENACFN
ncbi:hypothetical protein [Vibrio cholerae]|uniref:hypothetical protein n=1 Tax=Vibrio cholerae TaxID=666 RepID=UPI0022F300D2|nr:hypothetical protein [Vibrio cholerae]MDA5313209.1 hypothetical protein [Vibrio cholerae]MDA5318401.1 hypothetical protein [Vibrio cholerae]MDN6972348.1 hypothetical protein [Vibrio cholerae]